MKLMRMLLCLMLVLVLTGCTSTKTAPQSDIAASVGDVIANAEPEADVVTDDKPADGVILVDENEETLIYEDEYCSVSARFVDIGFIASLRPKSDQLIGIYLTDVFINGHPVDMSKHNASYNTSEITFKIDEALGFSLIDPNGKGMITPISPLKAYIEGWAKGEKTEHMSFTLHVINVKDYPNGTPNVAVPLTLRKP